jgi:hypothetical protein
MRNDMMLMSITLREELMEFKLILLCTKGTRIASHRRKTPTRTPSQSEPSSAEELSFNIGSGDPSKTPGHSDHMESWDSMCKTYNDCINHNNEDIAITMSQIQAGETSSFKSRGQGEARAR